MGVLDESLEIDLKDSGGRFSEDAQLFSFKLKDLKHRLGNSYIY